MAQHATDHRGPMIRSRTGQTSSLAAEQRQQIKLQVIPKMGQQTEKWQLSPIRAPSFPMCGFLAYNRLLGFLEDGFR